MAYDHELTRALQSACNDTKRPCQLMVVCHVKASGIRNTSFYTSFFAEFSEASTAPTTSPGVLPWTSFISLLAAFAGPPNMEPRCSQRMAKHVSAQNMT